MHCASLERTRRPWVAKVLREELGFYKVWVVCLCSAVGPAKHSVLGAPQVPVWRCSRCPSTHCQLVLLTALCVSGWVLDLTVQFGFVDTSGCSAQGYCAAPADARETCCSVSRSWPCVPPEPENWESFHG